MKDIVIADMLLFHSSRHHKLSDSTDICLIQVTLSDASLKIALFTLLLFEEIQYKTLNLMQTA